MSKTVEITDDLVQDYAKAIRQADNLDALYEVTKFYSPFTKDAIRQVLKMNNQDFAEYKEALKRVEVAKGDEAIQLTKKWGDILMPRLMLEVALIAETYYVPFSVAYKRLVESRKVKS